MKKNIYNYVFNELPGVLSEIIDHKYRSLQIFRALHKKLLSHFDAFPGIPKNIIEELKRNYFIPDLKVLSITKSKDKTQKFLFQIPDYENNDKNFKIETVLISEDNRNTICVSTQVGCNVGCEFCATGKMGFLKNLDLSQILLQVYKVKIITGIDPTNLVFMGMGEPFLNFENLIRALKVLTDINGIGLSSKKITISTVGLKTKIKKFADLIVKEENKKIRNTKLALSLHTTNQGLREKIIPAAKNNKLSDIYEELTYFYRKTKNKITYEYIFFHNLNDKISDINRLSRLSRMLPCNFNIIPFHPISSALNPPLDIYEKNMFNGNSKYNSLLINSLNSFITGLKNKKVVVNLRSSSGVDIKAACGQLATTFVK
jgi:23S rRNA (adenine2503-C2)-methyltransferase